MKNLIKIIFLTTFSFSEEIDEDLAYQKVLEKLDGALPKSFVKKAFSHEGVKIHKEIAERFAKPYEKKAWSDYRKIFVKESRISAGAKFYKNNLKLISSVSGKYGVDPFIIVTIAGVESNYGVHHSQFSVFNALRAELPSFNQSTA